VGQETSILRLWVAPYVAVVVTLSVKSSQEPGAVQSGVPVAVPLTLGTVNGPPPQLAAGEPAVTEPDEGVDALPGLEPSEKATIAARTTPQEMRERVNNLREGMVRAPWCRRPPFNEASRQESRTNGDIDDLFSGEMSDRRDPVRGLVTAPRRKAFPCAT
jgi:hypothetical protein